MFFLYYTRHPEKQTFDNFGILIISLCTLSAVAALKCFLAASELVSFLCMWL